MSWRKGLEGEKCVRKVSAVTMMKKAASYGLVSRHFANDDHCHSIVVDDDDVDGDDVSRSYQWRGWHSTTMTTTTTMMMQLC